MSKLHRFLLAAGLGLAASAAQAEDLGQGFSVTGGVTLVSDYRFRGISLSDEDPAVQGTITLNHESGFYFGTWASSIEDTPTFGHTEVDLYAGWAKEFSPGTTFDVGVTYYVYPNGNDAFGDSDYFEPYAKLSHQLGPVKATVGAAYAWGQSAIADADNLYLFTDASFPIPGTPLTAKGHFGYSDGSLAPTGDYLDWSLGLDAAVGPVTLGVAYVDTDLGDFPLVDKGVVFSVGAAF